MSDHGPGDAGSSGTGDVDFVALVAGQRIGRYEILNVLGQGSFGITYRARDVTLGRDVAIKEYLPSELAIRLGNATVVPRSTKVAGDFTWGRDRFVAEGQTMASLHHAPAIVRVFDFLEANGTAYIVMELLGGETLEQRMKQKGPLTPAEIERILWPLLDGLEQVHRTGFLHRDIKPANILLDAEGRPTLIDFGASRAAIADRTSAMTAIFTPGYAAAEQFTSAKQGPWTDIYGLSATLYHAISGRRPPSAYERLLNDTCAPLGSNPPAGFAPALLAGIDTGLTVRSSDRPQSISNWRSLLQTTNTVDDMVGPGSAGKRTSPAAVAAAMEVAPAPSRMPPSKPERTRRRPGWLVAAAVAATLIVGGGYAYFATTKSPAEIDVSQAAAVGSKAAPEPQVTAATQGEQVQQELPRPRAEGEVPQQAEAERAVQLKAEQELKQRADDKLAADEKQRLETVARQTAAAAAATQQVTPSPIIGLGNAVVTGFSGVVIPDPTAVRLAAGTTPIDLTFINPDGPSARIVDLANPGYVWDGRLWQAAKSHDILAKDVGQVFGIALDDAPEPNIYLAATSAFGLQIARPKPGGTVERVRTGSPGVQWQDGQFGRAPEGGPGTIYKVDGQSGAVTVFANVVLEGAPNPGPALGNIAYDSEHKQLFASDLYTGMIHRFSTESGAESGPGFDHGVTARSANQLPPMPFDPSNRPDIATAGFDTTNPDTWGYAPPDRRVWALAVHGGRLYYSAEGPQIWSVGIVRDGSFAADPRWELDVPVQPGPYPVSDILFSQGGAMILAQRAPVAGSYDYLALTKPAEPRLLRYWLETPDDPRTPSKWRSEPEEYAVGFANTYRNASGGAALGYGYAEDGTMRTGACEYALWSTGQNLRNNPTLRSQLEPGGPLVVHGLQGSPAGPVRKFNEPPTTSYFIEYNDRFDNAASVGHVGGVRIRASGCGTIAGYGGPGVAASAPYIVGTVGGSVAEVVAADTGVAAADTGVAAADAGVVGAGIIGGIIGIIGGIGGIGGVGGGTGGGSGCVGTNCYASNAQQVDIAIKKTSGGARFDPVSGTWRVEFKLDVTNAGSPFVPENSIAISDSALPGLTFAGATGTNWNCTLPAGNLNCIHHSGSAPFNTGAHLDQLVLAFTAKAPGKYENCATVAVVANNGIFENNLMNNRDCAVVVVAPGSIDLAIKTTAGGIKHDATSGTWTIEFKLDVVNAGPAFAPANFIGIRDAVPSGLTFVSAHGTNWSCATNPPPLSSGTLACTHNFGSGTLNNGMHVNQLVIVATTKTPGKYENCSTVAVAPASGLQEAALSNNRDCATVETKSQLQPLDVAIAMTGTIGPNQNASPPGPTTVSFTLAMTNVGPAFAGANVVTLTDVVPHDMTFNSASGTNWTCARLPASTGGKVTCTYTGAGPVAPGASLGTIMIAATAVGDGPWKNCADIAVAAGAGSDTKLANNTSCVSLKRDAFVPGAPRPPGVAVCTLPLVVGPGGSCGCPQGTTLQGRECLKPPPVATVCTPPFINGPGGSCICPQGMTLQGRECLKPPPVAAVCTPPLVVGPGGACGCPQGTTLQGRECVTTHSPAKVPDAKPNIAVPGTPLGAGGSPRDPGREPSRQPVPPAPPIK